MITHKDKIVIIGTGSVGEVIAYTLMVRALANDIVLVDIDENRAKGAALDIAHGTGYFKQVCVRAGGYEECADARIIIIAAGVPRKPGQSRLDLAKVNVSIVQSITENIMKYADNPLILIVSNPADIATLAVQKASGLSPERVIGSGTALDTARFRYHLSSKLQVSIEDVKAYIVGEHGDSQVPVFSSASVGGFPLKDLAHQLDIEIVEQELSDRVRNSGSEIIGLKGATIYGISMVIASIVQTIMDNENAIFPVTHVLDESFGAWAGVSISLPCRIGREGINQTLRIPMSSYENSRMDASVHALKQVAKDLDLI